MDAQSVVIGYALGYNDGLDDSGDKKPSDEWQPPDMPEPDDYEIYLLVEVVDVSVSNASKLEIRVSNPENASTGYDPLSIDWGDGTVDEWTTDGIPIPGYPDYYKWSTLTHNYTNVGQYLVKISGTKYSSFLQKITPTDNMPYSKVLCAKLGAEIVVNGSTGYDTVAFKGQRRLQYIKMSGKGGLPRETISNCPALKRIDIAEPPQEIYSSQFAGCFNLEKLDLSAITQIPTYALSGVAFKSLDLPNCTSIETGALSSCPFLSKVYAPNCTYIGSGAFANCYNLQKITVAEDCVFGSNCFANCYSLFPRPDGSIT